MARPSQRIIATQSRPGQTHSQEMAHARSIYYNDSNFDEKDVLVDTAYI